MSWHWWHVVLSWGATLGSFTGLALFTWWRYRRAARQLARLDTRPRGRA